MSTPKFSHYMLLFLPESSLPVPCTDVPQGRRAHNLWRAAVWVTETMREGRQWTAAKGEEGRRSMFDLHTHQVLHSGCTPRRTRAAATVILSQNWVVSGLVSNKALLMFCASQKCFFSSLILIGVVNCRSFHVVLVTHSKTRKQFYLNMKNQEPTMVQARHVPTSLFLCLPKCNDFGAPRRNGTIICKEKLMHRKLTKFLLKIWDKDVCNFRGGDWVVRQ